jgi:hypothetical protein
VGRSEGCGGQGERSVGVQGPLSLFDGILRPVLTKYEEQIDQSIDTTLKHVEEGLRTVGDVVAQASGAERSEDGENE